MFRLFGNALLALTLLLQPSLSLASDHYPRGYERYARLATITPAATTAQGTITTTATKTQAGGYDIYTALVSCSMTVTGAAVTIRSLVVGGAGSGGSNVGGGGGGAKPVETASEVLQPGIYWIAVGLGGATPTSDSTSGFTGNDSTFNGHTSKGGGGGAMFSGSGYIGSDGGGAGGGAGAVGTSNSSGYTGGTGCGSASYGGGAGGSAGANGGNAGTGCPVPVHAGNAGAGYFCDISGTSREYGVAGGGGAYPATVAAGTGATEGGGAGATGDGGTSGNAGLDGRGNGGGGMSGGSSARGGKGGNGTVIFSRPTP